MTTQRNDETQLDLSPVAQPSSQQLLDQLADEFVERLRAGERPSIHEYQQKHPSLAAEIEEVLCSVAMIEDLKKQSETVGAPPRNHFDEIQLERIGDYRIVGELGRGGMGIVFEAIHESLGRKVAIKVLPSKAFEGNDQLVRFRKEAQAAARLHHSNIVNVFGVGESEGYHYYVMEFVNGQTLANLIQSFKNSDDDSSFSFATDRERFFWSADKISKIADALEYSHLNNILHRDIKPANILVDDKQKPWITDFGLVKELSNPTMTKTGDIFGTPQYLAPETLEGKYNQRSEVYCLGLTLYELLAGQPAFFDASPTQLFKMIATVTPRPLRQINDKIPRDLETVVHKAIDRDPKRRYKSAGEFRDDLERFHNDLPIRARRVLPIEKAYRWAKRNPLTASMTLLSAVLLVVVAAISSYAYVSTDVALQKLADKHKALGLEKEKTEAAKDLAENNERQMRQEYRRAEANVKLSMKAFDELFKRIMTKGVGRDLKANMELEAFSELSMLETTVTKDDAQILQGAIRFYEKFTEQNIENDELKLEMAKAYRRIANTYHFLGDLKAAQKGYDKAIEFYRQIVQKAPGEIDMVVNLAETYNELGLSWRKQRNLAQGMKQHESARRLLQQDSYADSEECQYALCNTLISLCSFSPGMNGNRPRTFRNNRLLETDGALLRKALGDFIRIVPKRSAYLREADLISKQLVSQAPENPSYRLLRAMLFRTRATIFGVDGDAQTEMAQLEQSIKELQRLIEDYPENPTYQFALAHTYTIRVRNVPRSDQIEMFKQAESLCEELVQDYPRAIEYLDLYASISSRLGHLHFIDKELSQSIQYFEQTKTSLIQLTRKTPSVMAYYYQYFAASDQLSDVHLRNDNPAAARREIQSLIRFLQNSIVLNRARPKKLEFLDKARNKLRRMRD